MSIEVIPEGCQLRDICEILLCPEDLFLLDHSKYYEYTRHDFEQCFAINSTSCLIMDDERQVALGKKIAALSDYIPLELDTDWD